MEWKIVCLLSQIVFGVVLYCDLVTAVSEHQNFLIDYGYIGLENGTKRTEDLEQEKIEEGVRKFQKFNGLKTTGILDAPTLKLMKTPRCGNPDILPNAFFKTGKWKKKILSWTVKKFSKTSSLTTEQQTNILKRALDHWARVTSLTFIPTASGKPADIKMGFEVGDHGDNSAFDHRGGILGHAFYPLGSNYQGQVHFDDAEEWTDATINGTNLEYVALHELGHSLGLPHSSDPKAIMAPFYREYEENLQLKTDDINKIQQLYGPMETTDSPMTTTDATTTTEKGSAVSSYKVSVPFLMVVSLKMCHSLMA
ncbi:matrix metalloproteinase-19-like [Argonauta hians]